MSYPLGTKTVRTNSPKLSRQRHFESGYFVRVNGRIEAAFLNYPYAVEYVETRKAGGSGATFDILDSYGHKAGLINVA